MKQSKSDRPNKVRTSPDLQFHQFQDQYGRNKYLTKRKRPASAEERASKKRKIEYAELDRNRALLETIENIGSLFLELGLEPDLNRERDWWYSQEGKEDLSKLLGKDFYRLRHFVLPFFFCAHSSDRVFRNAFNSRILP